MLFDVQEMEKLDKQNGFNLVSFHPLQTERKYENEENRKNALFM